MAGAPRYREIEAWLRAKCQSSPPGTQLPPEVELADRFDVSRMTARQAVLNLAHEGLVERHRGVGTFVAARPLHRADSILYSFTDDMRRRGMVPSSRIISVGMGSSPAEAVALGLPSTAWLVCIDRVRLADGVPVARERVRLPGEFRAVLDHDLEGGSLHAALAEMGRVLGRATGYVRAQLATPKDAELLRLDLPATLLVETRVIHDLDDRPVESTETSYVGSRWVINTGSYVPASMLASTGANSVNGADAANAAPIAPAPVPSSAATSR